MPRGDINRRHCRRLLEGRRHLGQDVLRHRLALGPVDVILDLDLGDRLVALLMQDALEPAFALDRIDDIADVLDRLAGERAVDPREDLGIAGRHVAVGGQVELEHELRDHGELTGALARFDQDLLAGLPRSCGELAQLLEAIALADDEDELGSVLALLKREVIAVELVQLALLEGVHALAKRLLILVMGADLVIARAHLLDEPVARFLRSAIRHGITPDEVSVGGGARRAVLAQLIGGVSLRDIGQDHRSVDLGRRGNRLKFHDALSLHGRAGCGRATAAHPLFRRAMAQRDRNCDGPGLPTGDGIIIASRFRRLACIARLSSAAENCTSCTPRHNPTSTS